MIYFQGGYDGTHFLANVEVYDPIKEVWEDGVPLTSGRSGLASAVIYQPSIPGSYAPDCFTNLSRSREYDDKGGSENNEDENDFMSRGNRSSYHVNLPSNFYRGSSSGNIESAHITASKRFRNMKSELFKSLKNAMRPLKCQTLRDEPAVQENESQFDSCKIDEISMSTCITKKSNHSCPLEIMRKRLKLLIFQAQIENQRKPKKDR